MRLVLMGFIILGALNLAAQEELEKFSRIAVFPVLVESQSIQEAENAWYQIREELSSNRKFMVASKNFLESKDVLQPRGRLKPADIIILGRLLDAEAIITTFVDSETRNLHMIASESNYGRTLWEGKIKLSSSIPFREQLVVSCHKLIKDFMAKVPFQGYVVVDSIKAKPVYKSGRQYIAQVKIGQQDKIKTGDQVQFIKAHNNQIGEVLNKNLTVEVQAEGRVIEVDEGIAFVELIRTKEQAKITKHHLVRIPSAITENQSDLHGYQYLQSMGLTTSQLEENKWKKFEEEKKPLITSIAFLFNLATLVFLGF